MRKRILLTLSGAVVLICATVAQPGLTASAKQLITGNDIQDNSITTADVQDGSLLNDDFMAGQLPAGDDGAELFEYTFSYEANGDSQAQGTSADVVPARTIVEAVDFEIDGYTSADCGGSFSAFYVNSVNFQLATVFPIGSNALQTTLYSGATGSTPRTIGWNVGCYNASDQPAPIPSFTATLTFITREAPNTAPTPFH